MLNIPKCRTSDERITKICVNSSCNDYPFICKSCDSNECEIRHRHEKNTIKIIYWNQLERNFEDLHQRSSRKKMIVDLERELSDFVKEITNFFKMKIQELQKKTVAGVNSQFSEDKIYKKIAANNYKDLTGKEIGEFMMLLEKTKKKITEKEKETPYETEINRLKSFCNEARQKMKIFLISKDESIREADRLMEKKLFQEAEKNYDKIIKAHGQTAQLHFKKGLALFKQAKWKTALTQFNSAIRLNDQIPQYYLSKSITEANLGNWQAAEQSINKLIKFQLKDQHYTKKAEYQQKQSKFQQAETTLRQALKFFPNCSQIKNMLGVSYLHTFKFEEAEDIYKKLITDQPNCARHYYGLGLAYSVQDKSKQCLQQLEKAIKIDPTVANFYLHLGNTYKKLKNFELAKRNYKKALELQDKNPLNFYKYAQCLFQTRQYQEALKYYQKAISLQSKNPELYEGLVKVYYRLKDNNLAVKQLEIAKNYGLSEDSYFYWKGKIQFANKNYKLAEDMFNSAIKLKPNEGKYIMAKAQLYMDIHKFDRQTQKLLEDATKYNPNDSISHYKKGKYYEVKKDYAQAEIHYRKALENSKHSKIYLHLGLSLQYQNKPKEALQIISSALLQYPQNQLLYQTRINIYKKLGNKNLAEKDRLNLQRIHDQKKHSNHKNIDIEDDSSDDK